MNAIKIIIFLLAKIIFYFPYKLTRYVKSNSKFQYQLQ